MTIDPDGLIIAVLALAPLYLGVAATFLSRSSSRRRPPRH